MRLQREAADSDQQWSVVSPQVAVSDRIDLGRNPDAQMTVGFARVGAGERMQVEFPYDEVLVVTRGTFTVSSDDGTELTARAGEVIYLPAGARHSYHAIEDTEMVYVAHPPAVYARHVAESAAG